MNVFSLCEVTPAMLRQDEETKEFQYLLRLHNWMIRWYMFKKTIQEKDVIFMIWVSGIAWNLLRKASCFVNTAKSADDNEEEDQEMAKHLEFCLHFFTFSNEIRNIYLSGQEIRSTEQARLLHQFA